MRFRLLVAVCVSFCLLVALTYLASFLADWENASGRSRIAFEQGRASYWHNASTGAGTVALESRYRAMVDANNAPPGATFFKPVWTSGNNRTFQLPLVWLALAFAAIPAGIYLIAWRRGSRRHRNGMCTACGYDLRETVDRCPECATPRQPAQPLRWPLSIIPSCAWVASTTSCVAIVLTASMILACTAIAWMGRLQRLAHEGFALSGLDVTHFILATSPRLSGAVIHPPQPGVFTSASAPPGSVVVLDPGEYVFRAARITFDACSIRLSSSVQRQYGWSNGASFVRNSSTINVSGIPNSGSFELAMDDDAFIRIVQNRQPATDPMTERLLNSFRPSDSPQYWLGVLRSSNPEIRAIAADQLKRLNYRAPSAAPTTSPLPSVDPSQKPSADDIARLNSLPVPFDVEVGYGQLAGQIEPSK